MFRPRSVLSSTMTAGIALASLTGLRAAETDAPAVTSPSVEERIKALELEMETLHQRVAIAPKAVATTKDGFGFASADGTYKLKLWGYLQGEGRFYLKDDDVPLTNTFVLRRARIAVDGTVGPFEFRVMPDFGNGTTVLQDAYLTAPIRPWFKAQVGRSKVPIGLEFLQNDTVTQFVERAYPTQLVPNRDTGGQLFGDVGDGRLTYAVGIFNGATDGANRDTDANDDKDGVARLYTTPFKGGNEMLAGWSLGVAGSYGLDQGTIAGSNLPTYKTSGQATFFSYVAGTPATPANTAIANGRHWRIAPQTYYACGPLSTMAEYTRSTQAIQLGATTDAIANQAWQVSAGWVLTGESAAYKGLSPASPLAFDGSGWGACEIAARVHRLTIDNQAFTDGFASATKSASAATAVGVGINWYMTRQVKLKLDYERTAFAGGGGGTNAAPLDREDEHVIASQLQLIF